MSLSKVADNYTDRSFRNRWLMAVISALFVLFFILLCTENVYAKAKIVHLNDGDTYDISKAGKGTIVTIDDSSCTNGKNATVELKGYSEYVWVHISASRGKTLTVRMANGLNISPGKHSANGTGKWNDTLGHSCAGIYIDETKASGGIVILRSEAGAKINVKSYKAFLYHAVPAIMKNDTKTMLVFDTEDLSDPGTIVAAGVTGFGACAIGAFGSRYSRYTVGNITFQSGNIEAHGDYDGPGIGAYDYSSVKDLYFMGANVLAKAGKESTDFDSPNAAAGIGTSYKGNVDLIFIAGGHIEARGRAAMYDNKSMPMKGHVKNAGSGIGVGMYGNINKIEICGGTVCAYGGTGTHNKGCGIGTCVVRNNVGDASTAGEINITGGDITAVGGDGACGIGGCVKDITIAPKTPDTDLTINASIDESENYAGDVISQGAGIGIANNVMDSKFSDYPGNITIKGGNITAISGKYPDPKQPMGKYEFHGAGIGTTHHGRVSSINITGGTIQANGGLCSPGIGGPADCTINTSTVESIHISGGTITATKATETASPDDDPLCAIGGTRSENAGATDIRITGGNVIANGKAYAIGYDESGQPKNDAGEVLHGTKFLFDPDAGEGQAIEAVSLSPKLDYEYGLNDVYTKKGLDDESEDVITEFWLPDSKDKSGYDCEVDVSGRRYGPFDDEYAFTKIQAGDKKTLTAYTSIDYLDERTDKTYTGYGIYGSKTLSIDPAPEAIRGYDLIGYKDGNNKKVANGDYGEDKPRLLQGTDYVDGDGKWNANNKNLFLYFSLVQNEYAVKYDKNKPGPASREVAGTMDTSYFPVKGSSKLSENKYSLAGWSFKGWNTKADGSGDAYSDQAEITFKDWDELTLYAQWEPKKYTVTFKSGDANIAPDHLQKDLEFDRSYTLDTLTSIGWNYEDHAFHGWTSEGALGSVYEDGEDFCNLCTLDDTSGDPVGKTLTAEWIGSGNILVMTAVDGVPTDVTDNMKISLIDSSMSAELQLSEDPAAPGRYSSSLAGLNPGDYQLSMDGQYVISEDKQKLSGLTDTSAVTVVLDYYTVTMHADEHVDSAYIKESGTGEPYEALVVPDDHSAVIGADADPGYYFDAYTCYGVEPGWQHGVSTADQSITVQGKADLTAHAEANLYHVRFNGNKPQNASHDIEGAMDDQDFIFDEPQDLWKNKYTLTGWTFKGWNTKADGSGQAFSDGCTVDDAAWQSLGYPDNGSEVTLYAQWEADRYTVYFLAPTAESGKMDPQIFTYDSSAALTKNAFVRTDWEFTGWNTEPGGGGTAYGDEQEVSNLTSGKSITLYAQWEHDYYTVKFDKNDEAAAGEMPDDKIWTNCAFELPLCTYYKKGYSLDFWNTKADGSGKRYEDGEAISNAAAKGETLTLYALWKPNAFVVKFDANGGSGSMGDQEFVYDEAQQLAANMFNKTHYVFTGWNTMADGSGTAYKDQASVENLTDEPDETVTLYAQWTKETYTISYDLNGGTYKGKKGTVKVSCSYEDVIKLPKPSRDGYKFKYWKGSKYYAGDQYTVSGDHTFTAVWAKKGGGDDPDDPDDDSDDKKKKGGAKTGDETNILPWITLLLISAAGTIGLAAARKRR